MPYVLAVRDALNAAGVETEAVGGMPPGTPTGRSASIYLAGVMYWGHEDFEETVSLTVEWREERGWTIHDTFEPGAVRGQAHGYYGLGLGIVPTPADVAGRVAEVFAPDGRMWDRGWTERKTGAYDGELEVLLAGYGG